MVFNANNYLTFTYDSLRYLCCNNENVGEMCLKVNRNEKHNKHVHMYTYANGKLSVEF